MNFALFYYQVCKLIDCQVTYLICTSVSPLQNNYIHTCFSKKTYVIKIINDIDNITYTIKILNTSLDKLPKNPLKNGWNSFLSKQYWIGASQKYLEK